MTEPRVHLLRSIFAAFAVFALIGAVSTTANAQVGNDLAQLEARETALQNLITQATIAVEDLEIEHAIVLTRIDTLNEAIAGSTAALEQLDVARAIPAQPHIEMALEEFLAGDPATEAFNRALQSLGASPLFAVSRARSLAQDMTELMADREEAAQRLVTLNAALLELRFEIDEASLELESVSLDLEWYRATDTRSPISGRDTTLSNSRPALAIKIDNVPRARPQAGINQADLVFVELVEAGVTRLAAVYHSQEVPIVGPVRSMRTTDPKILQMLNHPLFANSGGNRRTTEIVNSSPLVNIGHATNAGGAYYRNNSRPAPHNLFSSTTALRAKGGDRGGEPRELFRLRRPGTPLQNASVESEGVDVTYPNTTVNYRWNGTGWARSQDGRAFRDTAGIRVAPETVIVQFTPYGVSPADAQSPEAVATGTGVAWIFTEGRLIEGTWSKPKARNVTIYRDANGDRVEMLPGRVWIELPPPGGGTLR